MTRTGYLTRRGYTLVELLVVMSLMILLAALAVGVSYSGMIGSQKVISGADRASGWLLIAKQRALRDGAPRGVRFFQNAKDANSITEAQYIEQPDVWVPNPQQEGNPTGPRIVFVYQYNEKPIPPSGSNPAIPPNTVISREVYFISTDIRINPSTGQAQYLTDLSEFVSRVHKDDSLILPEFGVSYRISVDPVPPSKFLSTGSAFAPIAPNTIPTVQILTTQCRKLTLVSYPELAAGGTPDPNYLLTPPQNVVGTPNTPIAMTTYKFAFQGAPQLLLGEPVLQLAGGVVIDYRPGITFPPGPAQPDADGYRTSSTAPINTAPYNPPTTIGVGGALTTDASGNYFDIVFAPSGQVLNNANNLICLWIRGRDVEDPSDPRKFNPRLDTSGANCDLRALFNDAGEQALVVVSVKSGLINTQPVNPPPASGPTAGHDPYIFARDGLSSGL